MKIDCFIPYSGTDGVGTEADALDFDEYIRQGEPEAAENAGQWRTAIGLQAVDGLKPSRYLIETVLERLGEKANRLGKRLGKNRIAILRLALQDSTISSVEMAKRIGISTTAIDNNIRQMRDLFIRHVGPAKGGHWEILADD